MSKSGKKRKRGFVFSLDFGLVWLVAFLVQDLLWNSEGGIIRALRYF